MTKNIFTITKEVSVTTAIFSLRFHLAKLYSECVFVFYSLCQCFSCRLLLEAHIQSYLHAMDMFGHGASHGHPVTCMFCRSVLLCYFNVIVIVIVIGRLLV